ncbi:hypothetical protein [Haloechinothrix sp. LS1_15]|uniref:hypothetical protein n=1 Tax=Haloechinothrix sp. LS1_15 TaxID=2652248 RepID=UPI00294753F6|nr:hypothetical protein [Haloechinothrix sp. LS1_15]MDV6011556.1 hypothetical protein [Haloechinothrix sp. LS1_15]
MATRVTDRQVVAVLRPFVRATGPVLDVLREADPLSLRARAAAAAERGDVPDELGHLPPAVRRWLLRRLGSWRVPGTPAWRRMSPAQRERWWINRVGRFTALLASLPGLGGALARRFPVQSALSAASQGVLLCAIAGEYGMTGHAERVRMIAWVLFGRDIDGDLAAGKDPSHDQVSEDAETADLGRELGGAGQSRRGLGLTAVARTLWRLGRSLQAIGDELDARPRGRFWQRWLGAIPVVGVVGNYLGERSALKRVARAARAYRLAQQRPHQ